MVPGREGTCLAADLPGLAFFLEKCGPFTDYALFSALLRPWASAESLSPGAQKVVECRDRSAAALSWVDTSQSGASLAMTFLARLGRAGPKAGSQVSVRGCYLTWRIPARNPITGSGKCSAWAGPRPQPRRSTLPTPGAFHRGHGWGRSFFGCTALVASSSFRHLSASPFLPHES
jgi:hypothetical protein